MINIGDTTQDELIGKIYDSATNPGDWLELVQSIGRFTQPQITEEGLEVHPPAERVKTLIAHLERASRNNEYIHALEDQKQTLNSIYNNMPWPVLMLDVDMRVIDLRISTPCVQHSEETDVR